MNCVRETCLLGVITVLDDTIISDIEKNIGHRVEQVLISRSELDYYWAYAYIEEMNWASRDKLSVEKPHNSAIRTFTLIQKFLIILMIIGIVVGVAFNALQTALIINIIVQVYYFLMVAFRMFIMLNGPRRICSCVSVRKNWRRSMKGNCLFIRC